MAEDCKQCDGCGVGSMVWVGPGRGDWALQPCAECAPKEGNQPTTLRNALTGSADA